MQRRAAGVGLLAIAAFLYVSRYLVAAIWGSGIRSWGTELFKNMMRYVGTSLWTWATVAALAGLVYIIWAEVEHD